MIHYVIDRLKTFANLGNLVSDDNIYPMLRAQGTEVPAIVVELKSMEPNHTKERASEIDRYVFHITSFANRPSTAWDMATLIRTRLETWKDEPPVLECRITDTASDVFESTEIFHFVQEFEMLAQ